MRPADERAIGFRAWIDGDRCLSVHHARDGRARWAISTLDYLPSSGKPFWNFVDFADRDEVIEVLFGLEALERERDPAPGG